MSDVIKIGKRPNILKLKRSEVYFEMFTTDLERIKQFIAASNYPEMIDPYVILKINIKAVKLSEQDFVDYFEDLDYNEQVMLYLFENIINVNSRRRINRIIMKLIDHEQQCNETELIDLMQWQGSNQSYYSTMVAIERGEIF
jgi:hypothetical protein